MTDLPRGGAGGLLALVLLGIAAALTRSSLDLLAALLLLALVLPRAPRFSRIASITGGLLLALATLYDAAERATAYFFARPIDLQYDVFLLPAVWDLLRDSSGTLTALGATVLVTVAVAALAALYGFLLRRAAAAQQSPAPRAALIVAAISSGGLAALGLLDDASRAERIATGLYEAAVFSEEDAIFERELAIARGEGLTLPRDLQRIAGQDFMLFFVESYGRLLWDDPVLRTEFQATLGKIEGDLDAAGYRTASRFLRSPTFGGASWLAHMSVMSGVDCSNQTRWERLLASDVTPLPVYFRDRGYETVSVMPAMWIDSWPEGEYFGFSRDIWARELAYPGPQYAWSPMPDQFVLLRFQELALQPGAAPVFAELSLTSSHSPFSVRPVFHDGAWRRDALEATLNSVDVEAIPWSWDEQNADQYQLAVAYSVRSVTHFLARHYDREGTLVILGDHQATKAIHRVDSEGIGHIWDVPMHVLTRDRELHRRLLERGFRDGMNPDESAAALPMPQLKTLILNLLHEAEPAQ